MKAKKPRPPRRVRLLLWAGSVLAGLTALGALVLGDACCKLDYGRILSRDGWQRPDRVLAALQLRPGDTVADLGAGKGYFTFRLSQAVGRSGHVWAVDVDPLAVRRIQEMSLWLRTGNVSTVLVKPDDPGLQPGSVDLVFLCNTYHHLPDRATYLRRLGAALKPTGRIAIVELKPLPLLRLMGHAGHTTSASVLRRDLHAAGFSRAQEHRFLPFQSFVIFER